MLGWDAKNNPRKTGLHEILGRDYGIEEHYGIHSGHTRGAYHLTETFGNS